MTPVMEGSRLLFCLPGQIQTHHLKPEGEGEGGVLWCFLILAQVPCSSLRYLPFCPWLLVCPETEPSACVCAGLCLPVCPADTVLLPSMSSPGTTK